MYFCSSPGTDTRPRIFLANPDCSSLYIDAIVQLCPLCVKPERVVHKSRGSSSEERELPEVAHKAAGVFDM